MKTTEELTQTLKDLQQRKLEHSNYLNQMLKDAIEAFMEKYDRDYIEFADNYNCGKNSVFCHFDIPDGLETMDAFITKITFNKERFNYIATLNLKTENDLGDGRTFCMYYDDVELSDVIYEFEDLVGSILQQMTDGLYIPEREQWFNNLDFETMEKISGYKQTDFSAEDGYQEFVDACTDWWGWLTTENKQEYFEDLS